jgi:hypothetical protein
MELSLWENLLLGAMVLGVIFWMKPGIVGSLKRGEKVESDWVGVLVPIGLVVVFVIFLISTV